MSETGAGVSVRRRRRSGAEAERLVAEYEASGLTRQAFCAGHGLSVAALDKYRRRHGRASTRGAGRMVPVEVVTGPASPTSGMGSGLWLELPKGLRIAVGRGFDSATLERLLAMLVEGVARCSDLGWRRGFTWRPGLRTCAKGSMDCTA